MARQHRLNGVTGAVVDGTVRDLGGIRRVGLPILGWGKGTPPSLHASLRFPPSRVWRGVCAVPGHGPFACGRINVPVTVGDVRAWTPLPATPVSILPAARPARQPYAA